MNPNAQSLIGRIRRSGASNADKIAENVELAFKIAPAFEAKAKAIRSNTRLSDAGHNDEIITALKSGPLAHLAQIRASIFDQLNAVEAKREVAMAPPKMTAEQRGDVVGEMQRAELRGWLRGLEPAERLRLLLEGGDPGIREAALLASPVLSGLSKEHSTLLIERAAQDRHGPALKAWEREAEALESAVAAVDVAERDLFAVAGVAKSAVAA